MLHQMTEKVCFSAKFKGARKYLLPFFKPFYSSFQLARTSKTQFKPATIWFLP